MPALRIGLCSAACAADAELFRQFLALLLVPRLNDDSFQASQSVDFVSAAVRQCLPAEMSSIDNSSNSISVCDHLPCR